MTDFVHGCKDLREWLIRPSGQWRTARRDTSYILYLLLRDKYDKLFSMFVNYTDPQV